MMKRIILILLAALCCTGMAFAQSEVGRQINEIKRTGDYFYAESTVETEEAAREAAVVALVNYINDYVRDNNLPSDRKVTEANLADAPFLKMKRGALMRVFVYVKKSDFVPVEETASTSVGGNETSVAAGQTAQTSSSVQDLIINESISGLISDSKSASAAETTSKSSVAATTSSQEVVIEAWQQTAINDLMAKSSLNDAAALLNRMQSEYKVKRFGTYKECRNVNSCYWIVFDNDSAMSLITILGPGSDARMNFKTKQADSLKNYAGKNVVWFEFGK